jgi:hypothetical protein
MELCQIVQDIQWNLSNTTYQVTMEMCQIV